VVLTLLSTLCGESCLLILWRPGDRCNMVGSDEDHGRSRRPGTEDRGWSSTGWVLSGRTIGRLYDAMCGLRHARGDQEHRFLGRASQPKSMFCQWSGLKTTGIDLLVWASKLTAMVW
jgi:hypothetical protein